MKGCRSVGLGIRSWVLGLNVDGEQGFEWGQVGRSAQKNSFRDQGISRYMDIETGAVNGSRA